MNNVIDYMNICKILKRYSFDEKMKVCSNYSSLLIDINGNMNKENVEDIIFPWELETFLLMSIKANPEYKDNNFEGKNRNKFIQMINGIRNYEHPVLHDKHGDISFADYYLSAAGLIQFDIQEDLQYKMYRYSYIFNFCNDNINMVEEFARFFGTNYCDFLSLGTYLLLLYGSHIMNIKEVIEYFAYQKYPVAFQGLIISLDKYKEQLDCITTKVEDYITCLRPSYKYPFIIKDEQIYCPLPHLIGRAISSSLLYRITEGNNILRAKIGKEILESYLIKILRESNAYDELYSEEEFKRERHNIAKTLDAMMRDGEDYLFLDCKISVPSIGLRTFNEESHKYEIDRLTEKIIQIYNHLTKFLPKYDSYNHFIGNPIIDESHKWGISVVLEDSYIRRSIIYENAAKKLCIDLESEKYKWMVKHIKIASLYNVERYAFMGKSLLEALKDQQEQERLNDYAFPSYSSEFANTTNEKFKQFVNKMFDKCEEITQELIEKGIIK